jgi:hypothetical protein
MLLVVVFAFICWVWFGTYYKIEGMTLIVRCGPFVKQFDINKIEQVRDTHNPLSAPALSIDRLELRGQGVYILISPEDKSAFVKDLKEINDRIVYLS